MENVSYPQRGKSRLRSGRWSEPGSIYHVTFNTVSRKPSFGEWAPASAVARVLTSTHLWRGSRLLCWVLMPDHWHGLIELGAMDTLSALVGRIKSATARSANSAIGCQGAVWEQGFHDHGVRREEDVLAIARYIVRNPVRARLVDRVGSYPFWDAVWLQQSDERGEKHHG